MIARADELDDAADDGAGLTKRPVTSQYPTPGYGREELGLAYTAREPRRQIIRPVFLLTKNGGTVRIEVKIQHARGCIVARAVVAELDQEPPDGGPLRGVDELLPRAERIALGGV